MSKELYLTWDTERKLGSDNLIMLVEQDNDKKQTNILFTTNLEIGIKNITELIQDGNNRCVACGVIIPEGYQVCPNCSDSR